MDIRDVYDAALSAELQHVPVDWRKLCEMFLNASAQTVAGLNAEIQELKSQIEDPD